MEGQCLICGQFRKLSFEHVPPKNAFNNRPIFIHKDFGADNPFTKKKSNKGFGSDTLCEACNNNTGNWYAKDFGVFAREGMTILKASENTLPIVKGVYNIKPLNVFKQILTMFMSADKSGILRSKEGLVEFILNKSSNDLPKDLNIHLYSNASPVKRMLGYCTVADALDPNFGVRRWSEINFQPFGYFLTDNCAPATKSMVNITEWHGLKYDTMYRVEMTTAYLKVSSPMIGTYE